MKHLTREKRRLQILQELTLDQADRVQRLQMELHLRPEPLTMPAPKQMELPPPPPLMRGMPEPKALPEEPMPDPAEELALRLGLPPQQT